MAETDVFERRLRAALARRTDGGPNDFDALAFARLAAEKEPRRHGLGAVLAWRHAGVPRAAWVLLLVGLLAALVVGTLAVGSQPQRNNPAVVAPVATASVQAPAATANPLAERTAKPAEPAFQCPPGSTPDQPGPADQARPPTFDISLAFDRAAGKIVALGDDGTWTFDVCTNTWTQMHPASAPSFDLFKMLVYDAGARQTIYVAGGRVWAYEVASDTWTMRGDAPEIEVLQVRLVYDPVGGRVVALELGAPGPTWSGRMWSYDAGPGTWQPIAQHEQLSADADGQLLLAYDQSVDRLVSYSLDGEVRLFDLRTNTWSAPGAESPPFTYGTLMMNPFSFGGEIAYDEVARKTVLFSNGAAIAYDAGADRWETLCGGSLECAIPPECRTSPHMVYDPTNERLVVYGGTFCTGDYWHPVFEGYGPPNEVLAFDLRTREWTVLVEPSAARPAPR
jgi:hypothetical protein